MTSTSAGRRIPIAGHVYLDVSISLENVPEPVIIKGLRVYLIRNKQWKNLLLGCDVLGKLGLLPWQTLARRIKDVVPNTEVNTDSVEILSEAIEVNMVTAAEMELLEPCDLMTAQDLREELEDVQKGLVFQRLIEKFVPALYGHLMDREQIGRAHV